MVHEQVVVERIRMIEVDCFAIIKRQVLQVAIIRVLLNERRFARTHGFKNAIRNRRFPRACAAANTDNHKKQNSESQNSESRRKEKQNGSRPYHSEF